MTINYFIAGSLENITYVSIISKHNGKWILCYHRERESWEAPGGHVEEGETPLQAAKRELYEETGATDFDIIPVWDYEIVNVNNGRTYFASIRAFDKLPENSEMEKIDFFETLTGNVTYNRDEMIETFEKAEKIASAHYV
jgi:8-oxo-dGTP diphosphatase